MMGASPLPPFLAWVAALPEDAVQPNAARAVLSALAAYADGGRDDPTHAEVAALSGYASRTVERYVAALAKPESGVALVTIETRRTAEGWQRNRYRLLAPPSVTEAADEHMVVAHLARDALSGPGAPLAYNRQPAASVAAGPAAWCASLPPERREACRQFGGPAAAVTGGTYNERACAPARPVSSLLPSFLDFHWPSDEVRKRAARILDAAGPGLAPLEENPERMLRSLANLLLGEWAHLDVDADILPVVRDQTRKARPKPLADFKLPARDVATVIGRRTLRGVSQITTARRRSTDSMATKKARFEPPEASPVEKCAKRLAGLRGMLAIIESGQQPEWLLDMDERAMAQTDTEAAFTHAAQRMRAELAALET